MTKQSLRERLESMRPRVVSPSPPDDRIARLRKLVQRTEAGWKRPAPRPPAGDPWVRSDHDFPLEVPYGRSTLAGLAGVSEAESGLLHVVPDREPVDLRRALFLDTETTGLSGGTGTYAFLVGVGRIRGNSFRVTQFLMRTMAGERAMLDAIAALAGDRDCLVTYNGRAFDMPLLETRFAMHRLPDPFAGMRHLDMYHTARRIFRRDDGAKLTTLEREVVGVERDEDIPGAQIPGVFFEALRTGGHPAMGLVLSHNRHDIRTLAALSLGAVELCRDDWRGEDSEELFRVGRHFLNRREPERAVPRFEAALAMGLGGTHRNRCLLELGRIRRRAGEIEAATARLAEIVPGDHREQIEALEELAKIEEHQYCDFARALLHVEDAEERLDRVPRLPADFRERFRARRERLVERLSRR